ncbi:MAG: MazG-like family protein [Sphingomonas phyllosphaerae]|uniref:MazG-like family protein n=1 Tax=Sphingomonas phyllosphaerae TaxID=257003 RepID=UPI002FF4B254
MTDATPLASEQITPETFLAQLRRVNTDRYQAWIGDADDAGILFDAAELGGEVGELLNVVKKLEREARGWRGSRAAPEDFADECADVLICLDKLARRMDVDLEAATIRKFNATSDKVGLPQRLSATPVPGDQDASQAQGERLREVIYRYQCDAGLAPDDAAADADGIVEAYLAAPRCDGAGWGADGG